MNGDTFLILHGWGGNKPAHWQEHLAEALRGAGASVLYPTMPDPMTPNPAAWQEALGSALAEAAEIGKPLTVVCHSLGAINWLHYASKYAESEAPSFVASRVLLVAPPYIISEVPPLDAPPGASDFFPPPLSQAGVANVAKQTTIIASNSDDYATFEQTSAYADRLQIPIHLLAGAGHISPYWGYGSWPWVLAWCAGEADFPPQPRPQDTADL